MIRVNIEKARSIAHEMRREARSQEFAPWDIKATIPSEAQAAEEERQKIREKYAEIQHNINQAISVDGLKEALAGV